MVGTGIHFRTESRDILFFETSIHFLQPTPFPIQWVMGGILSGSVAGYAVPQFVDLLRYKQEDRLLDAR